jgi:hypothetical protein
VSPLYTSILSNPSSFCGTVSISLCNPTILPNIILVSSQRVGLERFHCSTELGTLLFVLYIVRELGTLLFVLYIVRELGTLLFVLYIVRELGTLLYVLYIVRKLGTLLFVLYLVRESIHTWEGPYFYGMYCLDFIGWIDATSPNDTLKDPCF